VSCSTPAPFRTEYFEFPGGLALANGILNAANTAPLDVLVFERDTDEYLKERGGYQIRVWLTESSLLHANP
jgi:hypothetical protein